jgi:hypothetical protein
MKKYSAIGLFFLLIGLFAYHFYAANNAELKLDESIKEIAADKKFGISVSYSSINVSPFSGDILFNDLNIIGNKEIRRAGFARFDLHYLDFLNFSLFGPEYGLKRIDAGKLELMDLSLTVRKSLAELKTDSLAIDYSGNLWKLLTLGLTDSPLQATHHFDASGTKLTLSRPEYVGVVKADTLFFQAQIEQNPGGRSFTGSTNLSDIIWTPTESFQEKYSFFLKGFGYQTHAIPFRKATAEYDFKLDTNALSIPMMKLHSELFTGSLSGDIGIVRDSLSKSAIDSLLIQFGDLSPKMQRFLSNAEKLFGIRIPMKENKLSMTLTGTIDNPKIIVLDK